MVLAEDRGCFHVVVIFRVQGHDEMKSIAMIGGVVGVMAVSAAMGFT